MAYHFIGIKGTGMAALSYMMNIKKSQVVISINISLQKMD